MATLTIYTCESKGCVGEDICIYSQSLCAISMFKQFTFLLPLNIGIYISYLHIYTKLGFHYLIPVQPCSDQQ